MSGTSNALPKTEWFEWLDDTYKVFAAHANAAISTLANRSIRNEERVTAVEEWLGRHVGAHEALAARVKALEDQAPPKEPEEPDEPPEEPQEPAPSGFGDATHAVAPLVDEAFDRLAPTVRTGQVLTAKEAEYHAAFTRAFFRNDPIAELNIEKEFGRDDSYHIGRWGQAIQDPALQVQARTGDARILDRLTIAWRLAFDNLHIEWNPTILDDTYIREWAGARVEDGQWRLSGGKTPWSPYPKWLYAGRNGVEGGGTDLNRLQTIKPWGILVEYLWALELNRGKQSPAGIDYGAEADLWKPILRGFISTWSEDTTDAWAKNYPGRDGGMLWGSNSTRAREGTWPIFVRGEGHAIYNSAIFHYYCGLLGQAGWDIPNPDGAIAAADQLVEFIRDNMVPSKDSAGRPCLILKGGAAMTAMKATYTNYAAMSLAHLRDIGRWNDDLLDDETMLQISRAYDDMIKTDGSTLGDLASEVDRTGHGLKVDHGSPRTSFQTAVYGFAYPLIWEEGDSLLEKALAAQSTAGGLSNAKAHVLPAAMLAREVGP